MEVGDQIFSVNDEIIIEKKTTKNVINETGSFITLHLYKKGKTYTICKILESLRFVKKYLFSSLKF